MDLYATEYGDVRLFRLFAGWLWFYHLLLNCVCAIASYSAMGYDAIVFWCNCVVWLGQFVVENVAKRTLKTSLFSLVS